MYLQIRFCDVYFLLDVSDLGPVWKRSDPQGGAPRHSKPPSPAQTTAAVRPASAISLANCGGVTWGVRYST